MIGTKLGHYEIAGKLGEGGMGVVYRARDATLDREVAIKVLPVAFARNTASVTRFRREARLLAKLDHPNICAIHGLEESGNLCALVMELVDGPTLADRLAAGPLPLDEALPIARQISAALESAHVKGIVHRDLKPANIKVKRDGRIKVLDFGLAKALEAEGAVENPEHSPTLTVGATHEGVIQGTAGYMSPEQARGQQADRRADIWAFGVILYEMLAGRRAFAGKTVSESLAGILTGEPDWASLPGDTPASVRRLLRRCLAKDPSQRLHHIADARIELDDSEPSPPAAGNPARGYKIAVAVLAAALVTSLTIGLIGLSQSPADPSDTVSGNPLAGARFSKVTDLEGAQFDAAISPDGAFVTFVSDRDGRFEVLVGQLDTGEFRNLLAAEGELTLEDVRGYVRNVGFNGDGSEVWVGGGVTRRVQSIPLLGGPLRNFLGEDVLNLAWSPDGQRIAFHERSAGDPLYVADRNGTNARLILGPPEGMHQHFPIWSVDGQWIYLVRGQPSTLEMDLWRVRADGEGLEQMTRRKLDVGYPTPIDKRTVLYSARDSDGAGPWLWAVDTETKVSRRASVGLEQYTSVAASADGDRLVVTVQDPQAGLWSVPILDHPATEKNVEPFDDLQTKRALAPRFGGSSLFYLSSRGTGDGLWRYRDGKVAEIWKGSETTLLEPAAVSADGSSVVLVLRGDDGWRLNLLTADGAQLRTLSESVNARGVAAWSPDGRWIVTGGMSGGVPGLFKIPVDGGAAERIVDGQAMNPVWSPDGDLIVYAGAQVNAVSPLAAVRPDGSPVDLPKIEVFRAGERMRFLPDDSGLVYMAVLGSSQDFYLLDLATMKSRRLTRLDPTATMRTFDITPDGRRIVFDRLNMDSDIVLIELAPSR